MHSKSLLIAIAAFALTATSAQAFSGEVLQRAGLTESQRHAFVAARELRKDGDNEAARNVLIDAGIDAAVIERVRSAISGEQQAYQSALMSALDANDYEGFLLAIADSPLSDIITTEADFVSFKEAHDLQATGDTLGADLIFSELGVPTAPRYGMSVQYQSTDSELTLSEQEAYLVAKAANDRDAMQAILEEAGLVGRDRSTSQKFLRDGRELE